MVLIRHHFYSSKCGPSTINISESGRPDDSPCISATQKAAMLDWTMHLYLCSFAEFVVALTIFSKIEVRI